MSFPEVATSFTITKVPPQGGRYIVYCPFQKGSVSPYDRVQFYAFMNPPGGFDEDVMFESTTRTWTLNGCHIVEVFMDHREDLPIFTIIEKKGKYCRLVQIGGERQVRDVAGLWFSAEMLNRAFAHGTLELLS